MKQKLTILLITALMLSLATACGKTDSSSAQPEQTTTQAQTEPTTESAETEPAAPAGEADASNPVALLNSIWQGYTEDEKFSCAGGDATQSKMGEAGPYGIGDTAALDSTLGFPAADGDKIDAAASLLHMMNANTFTCGAFHAQDAADVAGIAADLKANILQRQWMCGFPDQLVIATIGDHVVSFFGEAETIRTFQQHLTTTFPDAQIVVDEAITL